MKQITQLKKKVDTYTKLIQKNEELIELFPLLKEDKELQELVEIEFEAYTKAFEEYELSVLFSNQYDDNAAIVEIHPGAGGVESCDWSEMLYRMYTRFANQKNFKITILDYLQGEEAGIKSVSMLVEGENAYGYLKCEKGVHRLVRISPFDAGARRHTSFASVDVVPQIESDIEIDLNPNDLEVDTLRASGAGGQHVNKTDSAVRITHIPTGITVKCQSGRSQHDNKDKAMMMLKSRLYQLMQQAHLDKVSALKGEQKAIEWGSQIRSYVMHPYSLVKDHRTNYETGNVQAIMDGNLEEMMYAFLKLNVAKGSSDE